MTPLEVVDTAVKVGLGALISGFATYWTASRKTKDDLARERLLRHQTLIESTAEQVEVFSHLVLRYWAFMVELVRYRAQKISWPPSRQTELDKTKTDLFNAFSGMTSAESKLLLLGHTEAQLLLREYGEYVRDFRRRAYDGNTALTESELDEDRRKLLDLRGRLYASLGAAYRAET
jgi:hypothetical protein